MDTAEPFVVSLGRVDEGMLQETHDSGFLTERDTDRALNEILNGIGTGGVRRP